MHVSLDPVARSSALRPALSRAVLVAALWSGLGIAMALSLPVTNDQDLTAETASRNPPPSAAQQVLTHPDSNRPGGY